jgi:NADH:ubiquinone oxidoreductase subunit 6 (subunit J)
MFVLGVIAVAAIACAVMALRAGKALVSALWLAGTSALVAFLLYLMGAHEIAVVELSVGAGLVTILFVFAISIAGDESLDVSTVIPRPVAIGLVVVAVLLLAWFTVAQPIANLLQNNNAPVDGAPLADVLWKQRGLDVLVQIVLIFGGVLGVIGLLAESAEKSEVRGQRSEIGNQKLEVRSKKLDAGDEKPEVIEQKAKAVQI